ncbi:MAG TPA: DUF1579 family protein [Terriglobales bacterium]|nr:DUF1579 family protein [Terriglobales bacterium]
MMMKTVTLLCTLLLTMSIFAQQPPSTAPAQIDAMKQCSFLVGEWKGEGWMAMGPGDRRTFSQMETVESKLDGLVLQIEGLGKDASGKIVHHALATVAYDPESKSYRFRSYENHGRYLDTNAECNGSTLLWFMQAGPRKIRYTIRLNEKQQWSEIGEASPDGTSWMKFFEMTLSRVK